MLRFTQGNLLDSGAEALVNTVNTVGVMGKGIALMFKEAFPENYKIYEAACKHGEVRIGQMLVTERRELLGPKWIINFPTKKHWRARVRSPRCKKRFAWSAGPRFPNRWMPTTARPPCTTSAGIPG